MKKIAALSLLFVLLLSASWLKAQQYGNFFINANKKFVYEKVFDAPELKADQIQPLLISRLSEPGIIVEVAADNIILARFHNYDMITASTKTKLLGVVNDGWRHFYGKIKVEIKDYKYRVTVTNMSNYFVDKMFAMEDLFNTKKPSKHLGKLLQNTDRYMTAYFTVTGDDSW